eukprot:10814111-Alexandrium_andersonii.AAC.1
MSEGRRDVCGRSPSRGRAAFCCRVWRLESAPAKVGGARGRRGRCSSTSAGHTCARSSTRASARRSEGALGGP